jgi:hypothetical protein
MHPTELAQLRRLRLAEHLLGRADLVHPALMHEHDAVAHLAGKPHLVGDALDARLSEKDAVACCGLLVVDIDTGTVVEWLRFEHTIDELYDVAILPGVRAAEAIGFKSDDIQREITIETDDP